MCRIIIIIFSLLIPTELLAWGKQGHAAIGAIADKNITPEAASAVEELLQNDNTMPHQKITLASIASWADEM